MSERKGELPLGWTEARLDDLGEWQGGGTPSKSKSAFWTNGNIPWVSPKDMKTFYIDDTEDHITDEAVEKSAAKLLQPSSVLVVTRSGILQRTLPVAINRVSVTTNQDLKSLVPTDGVEPKFVAHFLKAYDLAIRDECSKDGTTVASIDLPKLKAFRFMLPPLAEQRRIVAKIEALQERSRRAREALSEVAPLLEQLRQSVLAAAFRGDLTVDWRAAHADVEPASELLHRISTERRRQWEQTELAKYEAHGRKPPKGWQDRYREPEPIDDFDLPELPEGWCWTRLPELGYMNRGKSRHRPRNAPHLYGGPYPFVQTGDIAQSRGRIISHRQTYSEAGLAQSELWPEGTVCITIAANIASSAVLSYPACFPDSVVGLNPDESLCSPEFIEFFIRTAKGDLERFAPSTAQKNINLEILMEVAVPLPPPEESKEITRLLNELMDVVFHIEETVAGLIEQINELDQSILAKAFRGELTPQDPSDEPASVLLERIRAQPKRQAKTPKQTLKSHQSSKPGENLSRLKPQQLTLEEVLRSAD
jgi:type I restriction enzyme, S subunit